MVAAPHILSPRSRLTTEQLADLYVKHKNDAETKRLLDEIDALRFELSGANGRAQRVIEEKEAVERRMYVLLATVPGAGQAI